eukprot:3164940-Rhodomonas_salina.1
MSGTTRACVILRTRYGTSRTELVRSVLRACYAMSGIDLAYGAASGARTLSSYAFAIRCPILASRIALSLLRSYCTDVRY